MKQTIIAFMLLLALSACQKNNNTIVDPSKVVINITSPKANQVFKSGDSILIDAAVSYPSELHGYEVRITDTLSGFILYDSAVHVHNNQFNVSDVWNCTTTKALGLKLDVIADIDHNGTQGIQSLRFECNP
jgi:hypothetical protein